MMFVPRCDEGLFVSLQVTELECVSGQTTVIKSQKTELNQTIEELESALKAKEEVRGACYVDVLVYWEVLHVLIFTLSAITSGVRET